MGPFFIPDVKLCFFGRKPFSSENEYDNVCFSVLRFLSRLDEFPPLRSFRHLNAAGVVFGYGLMNKLFLRNFSPFLLLLTLV